MSCVVALLGAAGPLRAATPPRIAVAEGRLQGVEEGGVAAFKGIPFAAPPVGDLRWRAPQPATPWTGVRHATAYGPDCMQKPFPGGAGAPLTTTPSEDCLYANVWKPAGADGKLPVMVWIYGGGFVNGGASPAIYSGAELAKQGVMVVSFNYRVARFGTFGHPQLTRADADGGLLVNYGYLDMLAMLRWVRRNAAAFGGDPTNVTIVGESAGASAVHVLLGSPLAKGLFSRAVIQSSGIGTASWDTTGANLDRAEAAGVNFAKTKGIAEDDPQALAKLRALSAEAVVDGLHMPSSAAAQAEPRTYTLPVVDGRINIDAPKAYRAGTWSKVPVIIGATSDDLGGPTGYMISGARMMADLFSSQGAPTYYYRFSYVADSVRRPETVGAGHATDIPYFFNTVDARYGAAATDKDRAMAKIASTYLINFVKSGDPNGQDLIRWTPHTQASPAMLNLTPEGGVALARAPTP